MLPAFDLKTHIDPKRGDVTATLSGTTAVNGDAVDCQNYNGPIYAVGMVGAAANSPTAQAHVVKLQESADGSNNWADIANQDAGTITASSGCVMVRGHRTKRYVRTVCTPAFTGGSSPTNTFDSVVLGQKQNTSN